MSLSDYSQIYADAGAQYNVPPALLMAQGTVEDASGDPSAVGPNTPYGNAQGVSQFIPETAKALGVNPNDPKSSIFGQAKLMRENLDRYHNIPDAVAAYHGGTDRKNWGTKTADYTHKVLGHYTQMAQNQPIDEDDPFEGAKKDIAAAQTKSATPAVDEDDPFEGAKKDVATKKAQVEEAKKKEIGVGEDLAKTIPSSVVKGIGAIPQIPAMAGNAVANTMGWGVGKIMGVDPATQEKLSNISPFFTGNTPLDALTQAGKAIATGDPGEANPLTGSVLHDAQTMPGRYANALIQGGIGGPATGIKALPSLMGAVGAQTGSEAFPGNPAAPLIGGLVTGAGPAVVSSVKLRATPQEMASNVLQSSDKNPLTPGNINPHEIIPGSKPTLAQITGNPNIALLERQLQAKDPAAFKDIEDTNEGARQQFFEKASGTAQDIQAMENDRATRTAALYEQAKTQPLDPTAIKPIMGKIDDAVELVGEGSDAGKTLLGIKKKISGAMPKETSSNTALLDAQGNAITKTTSKNVTQSPLVQIYREERDNLQKPATAEGAYAATVKSVIQPIVAELGKAIESQSPPFAQAQQIYRDMSPKIDAASWLQGLKLTDATGRFTLAKVNNALQNANKLRNSNGLNEAKSLTPDQMEALTKLRDDLLRRESVARASMPRGSNTVQNALSTADMNTALGKLQGIAGVNAPELLGSAVGTGVGSLVGMPGAGAFAGDLTARALKGKSSKRTEAATSALKDYVLDPEGYKAFLLNQHSNSYSGRLSNKLLRP